MQHAQGGREILIGNPKMKSHLQDLGIDGRIILKCMLRK
jgi:hypothetical protein